jgi:hypothetical protein
LVGVRNFALFVNFWTSFRKEMNFSAIFVFEVTLAQEIGAIDLWVYHKKLENFT